MAHAITLASVSIGNSYSLLFNVNWIAAVALIVLVVLAVLSRWCWRTGSGTRVEFDSAELGFGPPKITLKPNRRDQEIAYKIWVELSTRKIGLEIDLEHDVITEVYDSWYSFFGITRELIKDLPVSKVRNESTREIISLSVALLNDGLRPHLTRWQARFRRWYGKQIERAADDIDPQAIQAEYPYFNELRSDLLAVNKGLMLYRGKMRELVTGLSP